MRIFFICGLADIDIAGNQTLKNTIFHLASFGHEIDVFTAFPAGYPGLQDPAKVFPSSVTFHRLPKQVLIAFRALRKLKELTRQIKKPSHAAGFLGPADSVGFYDEYTLGTRLAYIGFLFFFYLPFELVRVTFAIIRERPQLLYGVNGQGSTVACLLGLVTRLPVVTRWFGCFIRVEDWNTIWGRALTLDGGFALTLPCTKLIMANDGTQGDKVLARMGVPKDKVSFWVNGLDIDDLTAASAETPDSLRRALGAEGKVVLIMVSRLVLWKRQDRGLHLFAGLPRDLQERAILLVAGDGPESARLKQLAEHLGISTKVKFLSGVAHDALAPYYQMADVFLSLTDVSNLGNPILEAMYFGKTIVTIDDGSTAAVLQPEDAIFVRKDEMPAGVGALGRLILEPSRRETLGKKARAAFESRVLSWRNRIALEDKLLRGLV
ncbi:MAG: glycosyltransferase family 4 protein [Elusimicrobiota bacterium]